ncbi:MAG: DUF2147 domain-containing protein [Chitinophagales bacterium]
MKTYLIYFSLVVMAITLTSTLALAENPDTVMGIWLVPEKDSKVEIYKEEDGTYSGKIVWLQEPNDSDGNPIKDTENKDKLLAERKIFGMKIIEGFAYNSETDQWEGGLIYNPRNGKTYSCFMKLMEDGKLFLRGHIKGIKFLGKTMYWEPTTL